MFNILTFCQVSYSTETIKKYFAIYSNVYDDVINFELADSWKTQKSKCLDNIT